MSLSNLKGAAFTVQIEVAQPQIEVVLASARSDIFKTDISLYHLVQSQNH